jgi:hypothetical protein
MMQDDKMTRLAEETASCEVEVSRWKRKLARLRDCSDELRTEEARIEDLKGRLEAATDEAKKKQLEAQLSRTVKMMSRAQRDVAEADAELKEAQEAAERSLAAAQGYLMAVRGNGGGDDAKMKELENAIAQLSFSIRGADEVDVSMKAWAAPLDGLACPQASDADAKRSVSSFTKLILRSVLLKASDELVKEVFGATEIPEGCGWVRKNADPLGFSGNVLLHLQNTQLLVRHLQKAVFSRSVDGTDHTARAEHTLDLTIHATLMLGPWRDCMHECEWLGYGSDQPVQGDANKLMLFGIGDGNVYRMDVKPDSFLFWIVEGHAILALHSEHKADGSSDFEKALRTALVQYFCLKGILGEEGLVVPFVTLEREVVKLFVIVPSVNGPVWSSVQCWNVGVLVEAFAVLAAMYRLVDWVRKTGERVVGNVPKGFKQIVMGNFDKMPMSKSNKKDPGEKGGSGSGRQKSGSGGRGDREKDQSRRHNMREYREAAEFLRKQFGAEVKEQFPREMPVLEWRSSAGEFVRAPGEGPWYFEVRDKVWIKVFGSGEEERGENEAANLGRLSEAGVAGVPRLVGKWVAGEGGGWAVVATEHCGASVRRVGSWEELGRRTRELGEVLAAVHGMGRVHGDVKESNMCARPGGRLMLTDWEGGVAEGERPWRHTEGYRAPETTGAAEERGYCAKSDVYSAGVAVGKWLEELRAQKEEEEEEEEELVKRWQRIVECMTAEKVDERWDAERLLEELSGVAAEQATPARGTAGAVVVGGRTGADVERKAPDVATAKKGSPVKDVVAVDE